MANVAENLNALHKEVFNEGKVPNLIPDGCKLQKEIGFEKKDELGLKYVEAVRLAYPAGFTQALGDGTAGAYTLKDATSGTVKRAEVTAAQILLRDQLDYETCAKASEKGRKSFEAVSPFFYEGMTKAMRKRIEAQLFYGSMGIGVVQTYTGGDPSIVISIGEFAPGLWSGLEGTKIDIMDGSTSSVRGTVTISKVDTENRKLTLSATVTNTAQGDVVYFEGGYATEMSGVHKILANNTSLFGIDAATYSLWKSTSHSVGSAQLSYNAVKKGIAKAVGKGLDEDIMLFVSPGAWDDIGTDLASLRRTDRQEIKKLQIGAEMIEFYGQNGKVTLIPSIYVKNAYAYGICKPYWKRLGAADVTFGVPGMGHEMFAQIPDKAGVEARAFTHQAIFSDAPAKNILFTGIVNSV